MKKRTIKKLANRFLKGNLPVHTYEDGGYGFEGRTVKVFAILPYPVEKEVKKIAREKYGWDGCHWSSPLLLYTYEV